MTTFRDFFLESEEEEKNVKAMIAKLPPGHAKLLDGYKFKYQPGNTMKGDDGNIGLIYKDKITVAAPWNYGREFTTLHEVAHLVYEYLMTPELKKEWASLVKQTKKGHVKKVGQVQKTDALDQDPEEIFCMSYACCYAKHKLLVYHHPEWMDFIRNRVPSGEKASPDRTRRKSVHNERPQESEPSSGAGRGMPDMPRRVIRHQPRTTE